MGKPLIPPRYVYAPAALVYSDLPRAIIITGVRIWGLGWRYQYERTGPIGLDMLCEIVGLNRSRLYEHLARLVATGVLRYANISGQFTFRFNRDQVNGPADFEGNARASPENRTDWALDVVVGPSSFSSLSNPVKEKERKQQQQDIGCAWGGSGGGAAASEKSDGRSEILDRMGVLEPTRSELLALEHVTFGYLDDWVRWWIGQEDVGIGLVIKQMRLEIESPLGVGELEKDYRLRRYAEMGIQC